MASSGAGADAMTDPRTDPVESWPEAVPSRVIVDPVELAATVTVEDRPVWGALPPKGNPGGFVALDGTVCHYTAAGHGYMVEPWESHELCREQVRSIQRQHQGDPQQTDISYNACACAHGILLVGRVLGYRGGANGTAGSNDSEPSICALVGVDDIPTPEMLAVITAFHGLVEDRAGVPLRMRKHSDIVDTSCPGWWLSGWVDSEGYRQPGPPTSGGDDVSTPLLIGLTGYPGVPVELQPVVFVADGQFVNYRWIADGNDSAGVIDEFRARGWDTTIHLVDYGRRGIYGVLVGPAP